MKSSRDPNLPRVNRPLIRSLLLTGTVLMLAGLLAAGWFWYRVNKAMVRTEDKKSIVFFIHTGSGFPAVRDSLVKKKILADPESFEWLASIKDYDKQVKPGRYRLLRGMTNNELVNLLRSGNQEPVTIPLHGLNTREELAGRLGRRLEPDSAAFAQAFNDRSRLARSGVTPETLFALLLSDSYEFFWNTRVDEFLDRMHGVSEKFWTAERKQAATRLGLTLPQVVTLASIVEKESGVAEEKPRIAGVYLNRLRKGMPLQADPTVIFAWRDFSIRRVTGRHTRHPSPYNTYRHAGLPPGPICLPSAGSLDAVLNAEKHRYFYFCAREDFSGRHSFATDLADHARNARRYQQALDKRNIR